MATYPIKMLKDEEGQAFVPITGANAIVYDDKMSLQEKLDQKVGMDNIQAGEGVSIAQENGNLVISTEEITVPVNYSGTTVPEDSIGNEGDLYILIESE